MMLDILVSSLDFGSDLFWLLTGRFYQARNLAKRPGGQSEC